MKSAAINAAKIEGGLLLISLLSTVLGDLHGGATVFFALNFPGSILGAYLADSYYLDEVALYSDFLMSPVVSDVLVFVIAAAFQFVLIFFILSLLDSVRGRFRNSSKS